MSVDLLSNMLSAVKNAAMVNKTSLEVLHSNECESVAKVLKDKGYLTAVKKFKPKGKKFHMLRLDIAYSANKPMFENIARVSKPGRRIYKKGPEIRPVLNGFGTLVVSTSRGVMDGESAKKKKLGGEVLCKIW